MVPVATAWSITGVGGYLSNARKVNLAGVASGLPLSSTA